MKKVIFLLATLVTYFGFSQSEGFNYKLLITDNGNAVTDPVNVKISIKENGTLIWQEEHTGVQPDENGIAVVYVGEGSRTGGSASTFDDIDWSTSKTYDVEIDTGNGYNQMVSGAPFKFVPKAKFAESADFNNLTNKPEVFYLSGTTNTPTAIDDDIYHEGKLKIGDDATVDAKLYVSQNDLSTAISANVNIADNNDKAGVFAQLSGSGDGYIKGMGTQISASGSGTQINTWNENNSDNSGTHVGTYNRLFGTGGGFQTGTYNHITNSGDGVQYGIYNQIANDGNGMHIGSVEALTGAGTGMQVGDYVYLGGTGSGPKYGMYIYIDDNAGGEHNGLVVQALQDNGFAGKFFGNVFVSKRLKATDSGEADMKAYVYGSVLADGTLQDTNSSSGFTVTKDATGEYTVTFANSPGNADVYLVNASLGNNTSFGLIRVERQADSFKVYTANTSGTATDMNFTFVVYKK